MAITDVSFEGDLGNGPVSFRHHLIINDVALFDLVWVALSYLPAHWPPGESCDDKMHTPPSEGKRAGTQGIPREWSMNKDWSPSQRANLCQVKGERNGFYPVSLFPFLYLFPFCLCKASGHGLI